MLNRIRIVLVHTSHPGNIGAAARAMKTMGLQQLYLVSPQQFPHPKAEEMASGAQDVLADAKIFNSLDAAIADCTLVIGSSARTRAIPWPMLKPRDMAQMIKQHDNDKGQQDKETKETADVAILFGREQSGLTNEELQRCQFHVQIPSDPVYSSLNIAAALQVLAYELRVASLELIEESSTAKDIAKDITKEKTDNQYRLATADEMEKLFAHMEEALKTADFLKLSSPRKLMTRLRRLFFRARPDIMEMNILRGMLTAFQQKMDR